MIENSGSCLQTRPPRFLLCSDSFQFLSLFWSVQNTASLQPCFENRVSPRLASNLQIFLPSPPKYWGSRCEISHLALCGPRDQSRGLTHARPALDKPHYISNLSTAYKSSSLPTQTSPQASPEKHKSSS